VSSKKRHSRQEILDAFRACQVKLGRTPGAKSFCKTTGITQPEVKYYWPRHSALAEEVGALPNEYASRLPDNVVFQDFARVCVDAGKVPTIAELRIAQRELRTKTFTVETRFEGGYKEFKKRFYQWLKTAAPEFNPILQFDGWRLEPRVKEEAITSATGVSTEIVFHPFLPGLLQYFDVLARGEKLPNESSELSVSTLFERRTADAFRCLGFEISPLGQGTGRNADVLALARRERFAIIIDAKVRTNGYVLGTEDRKFLEYARSHGAELRGQGIEKVYFVVVGSSFKESDLKKLTDALSDSPIRSASLVTASALMRMVEGSIRDRSGFSLAELEREFFSHKIITE
jgi:hypothetical protein